MRVIALVVCACACAACGSKSSTSAPGNGAAAGDAGAGAAGGSSVPGPHVKIISPDIRTLPQPSITLPMTEAFKLVDAGAAPRARLRYAWDAKANREVTVVAALTSRRLADNVWSDPLPVPPVREGFGAVTDPVAKGGAVISFRGVIAEVVGTPDADARARADEYLAEFRQHIEHRRGTIDVDDRGQIAQVAFSDTAPTKPGAPPDPAVDEVVQRWIAASVPLPDEPIGKGAKWRVSIVLRAGAAVVKQTADYTLVEVRPDRWIIDEDVRRLGEDQLVDAPGLPTGAIAELIALFRENQGRVEVLTSLPWPVAGKLTTEVRIHARFGVPGEGVHEDITEDTGTLTFSVK